LALPFPAVSGAVATPFGASFAFVAVPAELPLPLPFEAARGEVFRAGRAAGVDCAGSSARVRGATIVLKV